jgi:GAF domain-containing protein
MQNRDQSSSPPTNPSSNRLPASAFAPSFLEKLRLVARLAGEAGEAPSTEAEALVSGPLAVEAVSTPGGKRYAVVRRDEPVAEGGKVAALYRTRDEALRAAAVLPAVAAPCPYRLKDKAKRLGYPLHAHDRHVGHLCILAPERRHAVLSHLHVARYLVANPDALALLLEAAGPEALPVLGRALVRRIDALLP